MEINACINNLSIRVVKQFVSWLFVLLSIGNHTTAYADSERFISQSVESVSRLGSVDFSNCRLANSAHIRRNVECAWIDVPEDWNDPESSKIKLFVVRIPAIRRDASTQDNPILFLAGGPGQAATDAYLFVDRPFHKLAKNRDFYLIDQRGTGLSSPLQCADSDSLSDENDLQNIRRYARECISSLPVNTKNFTTAFSVKDFDFVRQKLGVQKWNLYGVSYGTRVATTYANLFPDAVRSMVLDSAVPADHAIISDLAPQSQKALDRLFLDCAQNLDCARAFPNIESDFYRFLKENTDSSIISVEELTTGNIEEEPFTTDHLLGHVRLSLYSAQTRAVLLAQLHQALALGNFAPIARSYQLSSSNLNIFYGLHFSVMCIEDYPLFKKNEKAILKKNRATYIGAPLLDGIREICDVWLGEDKSSPDENDASLAIGATPLVSDIPTLLLAGELDPITPPSYAQKISKTLTNSRVVLFKGQGHFVGTEGCAPSLLVDFLDTLRPQEMDVSCLDRLHAYAPFINLNGS